MHTQRNLIEGLGILLIGLLFAFAGPTGPAKALAAEASLPSTIRAICGSWRSAAAGFRI